MKLEQHLGMGNECGLELELATEIVVNFAKKLELEPVVKDEANKMCEVESSEVYVSASAVIHI